MQNLIESNMFDIVVSCSKDYKGDDVYIIRYGLECKKRDSLMDAMLEFQSCLDHAMACEGLVE